METLPNEIILEIFNYIQKITDKRQFLRTCSLYNKLTKVSMCDFESNYTLPDFNHEAYYMGVAKFTLELCHDGYFKLIPERYINNKNRNLIRCLSYYNNLGLLQLAKEKGCKISNANPRHYYKNLGECKYDSDELTCGFAAQNGHLSILKFLIDNNCRYRYTICIKAIKNGHLDVLKYLFGKFGKLGTMLYIFALNTRHIEIIKWFEEVDCNGERLHMYDDDMEKVD